MADPYGGDGRAVKQGQQRARLKPALEMEDLMNLLHGSDPVRVELTRLENDLHYKEKELGDAQAEIRALRLSERAHEKAVEDVSSTGTQYAQKDCQIEASTARLRWFVRQAAPHKNH